MLETIPMQASMVPSEYAREIWEDIEGYMEKGAAYSGGRYEADDVLHLIETLGYKLWIAFDGTGIKGAVVTGFVQYPRLKALDMMFIGGEDGPEWKIPMLNLLKKWGADNDCVKLEAMGREGWERMFKDEGAKRRWLAFEIDIDPAEAVEKKVDVENVVA